MKKNVLLRFLALTLSVLMLVGVISPLSAFAANGDTAVEDLPVITELPDLFTFNDGSKVMDIEDWELRKEEIRYDLQYWEYGFIHDPDEMTFSRSGNTLTINVVAYDRTDDGELIEPINKRSASFNTTITLPTAAQWPEAYEDGVWKEGYSIPAGLGSNLFPYTSGYGYINVPDGCPDQARTGTYFTLFPYKEGSLYYDTGCLLAGVWTYFRVLDALNWVDPETGDKLFPEINEDQLYTYGFSRNAKKAMLASAFDDRTGMVVAGHPGQFAATSFRYIYDAKKYPAGNRPADTNYTRAELAADDPDFLNSFFSSYTGGRKEQINQVQQGGGGSYYTWFTSRIRQFNKINVDQLPVDNHMLIALIAPRPFMLLDGMDDFWNGSESVALSATASRQVWDLYGVDNRRFGMIFSKKTQHAQASWETPNAFALAQWVFRGIEPNWGGNSPEYPNATTQNIWPDFQYHPFNNEYVLDPSAIPWSYPGQYSLGTTSDIRFLVEGMSSDVTVRTDAPLVELVNPAGEVVGSASPVDGIAAIPAKASDMVKGVYTLRTVGSDMTNREVKIQCFTWEYVMRPAIDRSETNNWYIDFAEKINSLGDDKVIFEYDTRTAEELAKDWGRYRVGANGAIGPNADNEGSIDIFHYGIMLRGFQTYHKVGRAQEVQDLSISDNVSGNKLTVNFPAPSKFLISNLQFPDLFPGFVFDLTMDIPDAIVDN